VHVVVASSGLARNPFPGLLATEAHLPDLALASLTEDGAVLEEARDLARQITATDPDLQQHPGLAQALAEQRRRQMDQAARLN
jgi:ATP-dependent DNA helicase RecG